MGALSMVRGTASRYHGVNPFITDLTRGMRTELSGAVFEQWVAKTANWWEAEFGTGLRLHVDMRAHWLWPVIIAALDELEGAIVPLPQAEALLCMDPRPGLSVPVIAVHQHPMAMPFLTALPVRHLDFYREVRGGGDVRPAGPRHDEPLYVADDGRTLTAQDLLVLVSPVERRSRIALHVGDDAVEGAARIANLCLMPWVSEASTVLAPPMATMTGERCTVSVDL